MFQRRFSKTCLDLTSNNRLENSQHLAICVCIKKYEDNIMARKMTCSKSNRNERKLSNQDQNVMFWAYKKI